jgi:hypothetical protein
MAYIEAAFSITLGMEKDSFRDIVDRLILVNGLKEKNLGMAYGSIIDGKHIKVNGNLEKLKAKAFYS